MIGVRIPEGAENFYLRHRGVQIGSGAHLVYPMGSGGKAGGA